MKEDLSQDGLNAVLQRFNEAESVLYEKVSHKGKHRVRTIEVKNHVIEAIHGNVKDGDVYLTVGIYQTGEGAIKRFRFGKSLKKTSVCPSMPI